MKHLVFICLVSLVVVAGCSRNEEEGAKLVSPPFPPAEIAGAYAALVEKPDATRVFLLGDAAKRLAPYFECAGVRPVFSPSGKFDIIVVACGEMSIESCGKVASLLTEKGVMVWLMDVAEMTTAGFRSRLRTFDFPTFHLWMPEETRWVLVGRKTAQRIKLSSMLDLFAREKAFADLAKGHCETLPELFASYVGGRADVMPAFSFLDPKAVIRPENFVTRDIPAFEWISSEGVEEDIARHVFADMRSMQNVRRLVFEGNRLAAAAVDKKGEEAAIDVWARAALRNPNDLLLLGRINRLERNARGFLEVGRVLQAMKCYETIVLIRPNDPVAVHNFGMCLKKIGKLDMAEKVLARAKKLKELKK